MTRYTPLYGSLADSELLRCRMGRCRRETGQVVQDVRRYCADGQGWRAPVWAGVAAVVRFTGSSGRAVEEPEKTPGSARGGGEARKDREGPSYWCTCDQTNRTSETQYRPEEARKKQGWTRIEGGEPGPVAVMMRGTPTTTVVSLCSTTVGVSRDWNAAIWLMRSGMFLFPSQTRRVDGKSRGVGCRYC